MFHVAELVHWLEVRTNKELSRPIDEGAIWDLFRSHAPGQPESAPLSLLSASRLPTDLLVVLTTYQRARLCESKLRTLAEVIARAGRPLRAHVLVLCDASTESYESAKRAGHEIFGERMTWLDARQRLGKAGYWKTYQAALLAARLLRPEHALFLQDDVHYAATLLRDTYRLWHATESDPERRVLYLFASEDDEPQGRWVSFPREDDPSRGVRLTQWFDLQAYFVDLNFFELLGYRIVPVHPNRWRRRPTLSSGVGAQLTRRLFGRGNVYQVRVPLVSHGAHASHMNPEARAARSLDNLAWMQRLGVDAIC